MPTDPRVVTAGVGNASNVAWDLGDLKRRVGELEASRTTIGADSISGVAIAPNSITTTEIAAGTIQASDIAANTITAGQIAANTITAGQIAANTITAAQIAANTITAGQIAAATITASNIAAGAIDASVIAANAITTNAILAGAVTAVKIATDTITATQIAAGAITTSELAANSVTASAIVAGTIDSTKLNVTTLSSITSNMGAITAGTITGGTIQTASSGARTVMDTAGLRGYALDGVTKVFEINSGSGVASFTGVANIQTGSTIVPTAIPEIGGGNQLVNSSFSNIALLEWAKYESPGGVGTLASTTAQAFHGSQAVVVTSAATDNEIGVVTATAYRPTVVPGQTYTVTAYMRPATTVRRGRMIIIWYDAGGTAIGSAISGANGTQVAATWTRVPALTATAPSNAVTVAVYAAISPTSGTLPAGEQHYIDAMQLETGSVPTAYAPRINDLLVDSQIGGGNLITNSRADNSTTNWQTSNSTIAATTTQKRSGAFSFSVTSTASGSAYLYREWNNSQAITVRPSEHYVLSGWVYMASPLPVQVHFRQYNGTTNTSTFSTAVTPAANTWTRVVFPVALASDTITIGYGYSFSATAGAQVAYFTDLQLEQGDIATAYAPKPDEILPGSITPAALGFNIAGGNLLTNSSAESDTDADGRADGWQNYQGATSFALDSTTFVYGTKSQRATWDGVGATLRVRTPNVSGLSPGQMIQGSIWFKGPAGRALSCAVANSQGVNEISILTSLSATATGSWQRLVFSPTALPATMDGVFIKVGLASPVGGDQIWLDAAQIEIGDVATAYAPRPDEILPATVGTTELAALSVTAAKIAANTITASQIAANTITASQIAANTITASQIAANTITASQIAANTITASQIAANTITAGQIAAGTITATQIAAGAITTNLIAAGAVTAQKLSLAWGGSNRLPNAGFSYWTNSTSDPGMAAGTDNPGYWQHYDNGPVYTNGMVNPSFETNTTGWTAAATTGSLSAARITTDAGVGAACAEVTGSAMTGTTTMQLFGSGSANAAVVVSGQTITLIGFLKAVSGTITSLKLSVRYYNSSNAFLSQSVLATQATPTVGRWYRLASQAVVPANAAYAAVSFDADTTTAAAVYRCDGALVNKGPSLSMATTWNYFDGDTPGYTWTGTAHASTSWTTNAGAAVINYATNPSFETNTTSWAVTGFAFWLNTGATITRDTTQFVNGVASGKVVTTSASASQGAVLQLGQARAGEQLTVGVWLKGNAGGEAVKIFFGDSASTGTNVSSNVTLTNTWVQYTLSWTPDTTYNTPVVGIRTQGATAVTFFIDSVMVSPMPTLPTYFEGASSGGVWTGTANNSASYVRAVWAKLPADTPEGRNAWRLTLATAMPAIKGFMTQVVQKMDANGVYVLSFLWRGDVAPSVASNGNVTWQWLDPVTGNDIAGATGQVSPTAPSTSVYTQYAVRFTYNSSGGIFQFDPGGGLTSGWDYIYIAPSNALSGPSDVRIAQVQYEKAETRSAWAPSPSEVLPYTVGNTQLSPDSVTTDKILAGTILAGDIAAATITGTQIAANTITSGNISVGTLSAISANMGTITAGTITGATFQTVAGNVSSVRFDSTGINAYNASGTNTFNLSSVGALTMTGKLTATGVDFAEPVGSAFNWSPPTTSKVRWLDASGGTERGSIVGDHISAVSPVVIDIHRVSMVGPDWAEVIAGSLLSPSARLHVETSTVSAFAGGYGATIITNSGTSGFLQLTGDARVRINGGTGTVTFSASNVSNSVNVSHGLAAAPGQILITGQGGTVWATWEVTATSSTTFTVQALGNASVSGNKSFYWIALGV